MSHITSNRRRAAGVCAKVRLSAGVFVLTLAIGLSGAGRTSAERFPEDPVETFKRALILESSYRVNLQSRLSLAKDAAQRKELEDTLKAVVEAHRKRLEDAARGLTNLADVSRALFLLDWPNPLGGEEDAWQQVNDKVREELRKRLVEETIQGLEHGSAARKIALCNLTAENLVTAETESQQLYGPVVVKGLAKLEPAIATVFKNTHDETVRAAAGVALGRFVRQSETVGPVLGSVLADRKRYSENARFAAADALESLVLHLTGEDVIRPSEPGVTPRETRRTRLRPQPPAPSPSGRPILEDLKGKKEVDRTSYRSTLGDLAKAVAAAATPGATDPSPRVRSTSLAALRQAAGATAYELRLMKDEARQLIDRYLEDYPKIARDRERTWTEWEKKEAAKEREKLEEGLTGVRPAVKAFTRKEVLNALSNALADPDANTRLEARRTLDELSRLRRYLTEYDNQIPVKGKEPAKKTGWKTAPKARSTSAIVLTAGVAAPISAGPANAVRVPPLPGRAPVIPLRRQIKEEDQLGSMLVELGESIVQRGLNDPNPAARLATAEAVESLGPAGIRFIPRIVEALKDCNLFVRWVAARVLGKLAYYVEKDAPEKGPMIVTGLTALLDDEDLDPRTQAAIALGAYGPMAKSAVSALTGKLQRGDPDFIIAVIKSLEGIGTDAAPALPALAKLLRNRDQRVRAEAARAVGQFGILAKAYVPELERLVEDLDLDVRDAATAAILSITRSDKK
jgi:HEAT repeat protein